MGMNVWFIFKLTNWPEDFSCVSKAWSRLAMKNHEHGLDPCNSLDQRQSWNQCGGGVQYVSSSGRRTRSRLLISISWFFKHETESRELTLADTFHDKQRRAAYCPQFTRLLAFKDILLKCWNYATCDIYECTLWCVQISLPVRYTCISHE